MDIILIRTYLSENQLEYIINSLKDQYEILYYPSASPNLPPNICDRVKIIVSHQLRFEEAKKYRNVKFVQIYGRGSDKICTEYLDRNSIHYKCCASSEIITSIAEYVVLQILYWERDFPELCEITKKGNWDWQKRSSYCFRSMEQLNIGIAGCGLIGGGVSRYMRKMGAKTYIINVGGRMTSSDYELLGRMDYVSLHIPLTEDNTHCVSWDFFSSMKKNSVLINTSRGGIVDENALICTLRERQIRGAALDVTEDEPIDVKSPLKEADNLILTPHIAGRSNSVLRAYIREIVDNIRKETGC